MPKLQQVRSKDIPLTEAMKTQIGLSAGAFDKYSLDITKMITLIKKERTGIIVEFELHIAHASPIIINQKEKDFYAAIEKATSRAEKALRRLHDKHSTKRGRGIKGMQEAETMEDVEE